MRMWFVLFTLVPIIGFAYIFWHVWHILPLPLTARIAVLVAMAVCVVIFFGNFIFGLDDKPFRLSVALYEIGDSTIFIALYVAMLFLVLDIGRLVRLVPKTFLYNSWAGTLTVVGITTVLFVYGYVHYNNKVRVPMQIHCKAALAKPTRIVMISDLHVGYHNRKEELRRWIRLINQEHPDLVLICGDIIDGSIRAVRDQHLDDDFRQIKAPIYAALGNHEYYAGKAEAIQFYKDADIHLLVDSSEHVGGITIIGRDDRTNTGRKTVAQLVRESGNNRGFTILLDHQPYHLEEAEKAGIDFQLSGHTHYGQVWPISWIEDAIYEDAFGSLTKGNTQYYVTSGIGIWGGKFRIGTRSEYVVAEMQ